MTMCMVLDDNDIAREAATKILRGMDLDPISIGDSEQALEFCKENAPQIILLDIMMPKIDGLEFLKRLRKSDNCRHSYVIACSARHDAEIVSKMAKAGVNDYLIKPFSPELLVHKIKSSGLLH